MCFLRTSAGMSRQLVNGLTEFRGHASRSNGHEANSGYGGRNLQRAIGRTGFREVYIFCGVPVRQAIGYEFRGREFESFWARTSKQKSPRLSVHSMVCAATGPFSKGQTPVQLGLNCGGNVNTSKDTLSAIAVPVPSIFTHEEKSFRALSWRARPCGRISENIGQGIPKSLFR